MRYIYMYVHIHTHTHTPLECQFPKGRVTFLFASLSHYSVTRPCRPSIIWLRLHLLQAGIYIKWNQKFHKIILLLLVRHFDVFYFIKISDDKTKLFHYLLIWGFITHFFSGCSHIGTLSIPSLSELWVAVTHPYPPQEYESGSHVPQSCFPLSQLRLGW